MKKEETTPANSNQQRSDAIISWLQDHKLISLNALAEQVGYSQSSLSRAVSGVYKKIPAEHLDAIENILKDYGFTPIANQTKKAR